MKVAIIIPCYKVRNEIIKLLRSFEKNRYKIYLVDDACPEGVGNFVKENIHDMDIEIIFNPRNLGVGGAVKQGYAAAIAHGADVIVKIDGDGQMNPALIPEFIAPILDGKADYTKGNRFYDLEGLVKMPLIRVFGNSVLSFFAKLSTGYWNIFDPNNGFICISADYLKKIPLNKIDNRFFFESDMLFRLKLAKAVVRDIPMDAVYGQEKSNLVIRSLLFPFIYKHLRNLMKRIFYDYYLRDMSIASIELIIGSICLSIGVIYGVFQWINSVITGTSSPTGTIMLISLLNIVGMQFILGFISYDMNSIPRK